jgi:hypothetical protein
VAVIGASLARALFGPQRAVGKSLTLSGDTYFVVGEMAPRKGRFFGENRQDNHVDSREPPSAATPKPIRWSSTRAKRTSRPGEASQPACDGCGG